jgi:hypothetical protein
MSPSTCARRRGGVRRGTTATRYVSIEVDDGIVLERLANLTDLDDFVAAVAAWVAPSS